ncbi:DUF7541 family protein [Halocatena pleomorpha]|uniref:Cox cluster protein n=1 Tax=Halocatena pleomorpha TaxID=1785090 RepID=A0A3P3RJ58_9EURY|nr:cox cluster protein [Halocatena pleomorpha]RRJ32839.1 cox cluster protein [Halocatena pleomorpha]
MDDQPGLSDQYRMSSPWPVFVALGLVLSELGVLFGIIPLSVGGLLLFAGSTAGILTESGYTSDLWRVMGGIGAVLVVLGAILTGTQLGLSAPSAIVSELIAAFGGQPNGIIIRGVSIVAAGVITIGVGAIAPFVQSDIETP